MQRSHSFKLVSQFSQLSIIHFSHSDVVFNLYPSLQRVQIPSVQEQILEVD